MSPLETAIDQRERTVDTDNLEQDYNNHVFSTELLCTELEFCLYSLSTMIKTVV